nr:MULTISPECIES: GGDEF domain-containing protein [unclassified Exiguobacterium]
MGIYGYLYVNVTDGTSPLGPTFEQVIGVTCLLATIALIAGLSFIFEGAVVEVTSELEQTNERLHTLASRDGLTGLYNRTTGYRLIEEAIREAVLSGRPYAVVLADIDHFKSFNERHGHDCGDLVLKQVASALTRTDGIAVRWGGEEFLLFLTNQSEDEAAQAIDHLRQQIKSLETIYEGRRLSVTMTFGVTTHRGFKPVDTLVKEADDRLRAGKQAGKDRIVTSIHH